LINLRKIKQKDNLLAVRNYYSKSDPGKDRILKVGKRRFLKVTG